MHYDLRATSGFTDLRPVIQLFHSLAEPSRLEILDHLRLGDHRVGELAEHLQLAQSTTSAHLAVLRASGLVSVRTDGRSSVYSLNGAPELAALIAAAASLLKTCEQPAPPGSSSSAEPHENAAAAALTHRSEGAR